MKNSGLFDFDTSVEQMPSFSMASVEATYLAGIDMRASGLRDPVRFFEDAGV